MAGFRDDFYYKIGQDYHEHMKKSFIYGYVRNEREQNLRLRMKEELFCMADTPTSKGRYIRFLVKSLLTDRNLAAGLDKISALTEFIKSTEEAIKIEYAEDKSGCKAVDIREHLVEILRCMERHPVLDIDVWMLRKISYEILNTCEFEGEKKNPYVQLTSLYLDMDYGWISESDFVKGLIDFFIENSKYVPGKSDMLVFQEKAACIWGKDVFAGLRKSADKLLRISKFGEDDDQSCREAFDRFASILMKNRYAIKLVESIQDDILRVEINTLLYDAGFSVSTGTYRPPRKKEKSMDILDAYFKYVNGNPFGIQGGNSNIPGGYLTWDEYYEACDMLRDSLNLDRDDTKHCNVFMPMWIDREVGGGVFLIGRNQFEESAGVHIDSNCELGVVYFIGVEDGRAFEFTAFQTSSYDRDAFPGMEEAVSWFQNYDYRTDALEEYRLCNSKAPDGCPEMFLKFFEQTGDNYMHETMTDDDIAKTISELDMEFRRDKKREELAAVFKGWSR